jgi:hypothetical protein
VKAVGSQRKKLIDVPRDRLVESMASGTGSDGGVYSITINVVNS